MAAARSAKLSTRPRSAVVHLFDHGAAITPFIAELEVALSVVGQEFVNDGIGAVPHRLVTPVSGRNRDGAMVISDTLVPRARQWMANHGWRARIIDDRIADPQLAADEEFVARADDPHDRARRDAISARRTGQIAVAGWREAERQIVELTRLFPGIPIIVIASNGKRVRRLFRLLRRVNGDDVSRCGCGRWVRATPTRITIATYAYAAELGGDPYQVVILADAADLLGRRATTHLGRVPGRFGRMYALRHSSQRLSPASEAQLEAMAGPFIVQPAHGHEVKVVVVRALTQPRTAGLIGLAWKRAALWCNGTRNRWIAQVAAAFADGDETELRRLGMANTDINLILVAAQLGVTLVVESPEHGRALQRQLGGWPLLTMTSTAQHHKIGDEKASTGKPALYVIATAMHLKQHGTGPGLVITA